MSTDNRDQLVDQLLRGVYRVCVYRDQCYGCPFFYTKCLIGEPKPKTWFDEDTIAGIRPAPTVIEAFNEEPEEPAVEEPAPAPVVAEQPDDDSEGTWIVSASMGSVFTKYVYICSKCGYKKESVFSLTPMTSCPECEKRKAERAAKAEL